MSNKFPARRALVTISLLMPFTKSLAAGCVATTGASIHSFMEPQAAEQSPVSYETLIQEKTSYFQARLSHRQFTSDRHFVGKDEQEERQKEGSEVINHSNFVDLDLTYTFNDRYSATLTVPFAFHDRSQVVRKNDPQRTILQRYHTQSMGLGDLRIVGNRWMLDPQTRQGNILLGLGLDIPSGQKDVKDTFMKYDTTTGLIVAEQRPVDQSIQLGDGGWGFIMNFYGYLQLAPQLTGYIDTAYTITPEETNNVRTYRSNPFEAEMSITDSYLFRTGIDYLILPANGLRASIGARMAGVPVHDLTGGNDGFRRPGYDISLEPGMAIDVDAWSFNLSIPVAIERNRERSEADKNYTYSSGTYRHGDAAFADYEVILAVSKRF